jgi:hypothetical protein
MGLRFRRLIAQALTFGRSTVLIDTDRVACARTEQVEAPIRDGDRGFGASQDLLGGALPWPGGTRQGRPRSHPRPVCRRAYLHPLSFGQGTAPGCFRRGRAFAAIPVTAQRRCRSAFRHLPAGTCPPATMPRHLSSERSCASIKTGVAAGTARVVHVAPGQLPHRPGIAAASPRHRPQIDRQLPVGHQGKT